jgi:cytochrome c oxidase cbb3-type subunit 3
MKKRITLLTLSWVTGISLFAADATETTTTAAPAKPGFALEDLIIIATILLMVLITFFIVYQLSVMRMQMQLLQKIIVTKDPKAVLDNGTWLERFSKRFIGLKPMEMEGELIMEEHEYDGIVELKNGMPPWLQAFFGITVVFAISYWTYYMVLKAGPDQYQEYQMQVDKAIKQKEERNKLYANSIDETNVELSTDADDLQKGKDIFIENCASCHRADAGGDSGPNLTDQYWIHGGGIKNVFKTIKIGYVEKGMRSWIEVLNPLQIKQVASYVLSLQGTNPAAAKSPQGELWTGEKTTGDSTQVQTDTLQVDSNTAVNPAK